MFCRKELEILSSFENNKSFGLRPGLNQTKRPAVAHNVRITVYSIFKQATFHLSQPYLLGLVLDYIVDDTEDAIPQWRGCVYAILLVLSGLLYILCNMQAHYLCQLLGMRGRAAYSSAIYRKVSVHILIELSFFFSPSPSFQ